MKFWCASDGAHARAPWRTPARAQPFLTAIFRFCWFDLTRSTFSSIHEVQEASITFLTMQTWSPEPHVHHTSISCKSDKYSKISKKMKFHNFSKKSAFFAIFCYFSRKMPFRGWPATKFWKFSLHLKCLKITPICPNEVVQSLRVTLRLASSARGGHRWYRAIPVKLTAVVAQKVVKGYNFTSKIADFSWIAE